MFDTEPATPIDKAMHGVVVTAAEHYFASMFDECACEVCKAVVVLEDAVGWEDLKMYMEEARKRISE